MAKYKIFISSNQKEFDNERRNIKYFIENTDLYKELFEVFIFEDSPADGLTPREVYEKKVKESDIFIGLIGQDYGLINENGISTSEDELNIFTSYINSENTYIFILDGITPDNNTKRHIEKASKYNYKKINKDEIFTEVKNSLNNFLTKKEILEKIDFDKKKTRINIDEFDLNEINYFIGKNDNFDEIEEDEIENFLINKVKVLEKTHDGFNVNNAGILFFTKNPKKFIPQHEVKLVRFKGEDKVDVIDSLEISKPMLSSLSDIEHFLLKNMKVSQKIDGFNKKNLPEYPLKALREAIINALAHRNYEIKSSSISVYMYDDRLEITSPGKLIPPISIDTIGETYSHRNHEICDLFSKSNNMEKFGSGYPKMLKSLEEAGLNPPQLKEFTDFFKIIFYNNNKNEFDLKEPLNSSEIDLVKEGLNNRQIEAIRLMTNEGLIYDIERYMEFFNISRNTASHDLNDLVKRGLIFSNYRKKNNKNIKGFGIRKIN